MEAERDAIIAAARPITGEVLEIGTGKGHFAVALARQGINVVSIDPSHEAQAFALLNLRYYDVAQRVTLRCASAESLDFHDGRFGTIFSINTVHHLKLLAPMLDECVRLLAPDGTLVISDFTAEGFAKVQQVHAAEGSTHEMLGATMDDVCALLEERGLCLRRMCSRFQNTVMARAAEARGERG